MPDELSADDLHVLGSDLRIQLAEVHGDDEAIGRVLARWHQHLGGPVLAMVCAAALRDLFAYSITVLDEGARS